MNISSDFFQGDKLRATPMQNVMLNKNASQALLEPLCPHFQFLYCADPTLGELRKVLTILLLYSC